MEKKEASQHLATSVKVGEQIFKASEQRTLAITNQKDMDVCTFKRHMSGTTLPSQEQLALEKTWASLSRK